MRARAPIILKHTPNDASVQLRLKTVAEAPDSHLYLQELYSHLGHPGHTTLTFTYRSSESAPAD